MNDDKLTPCAGMITHIMNDSCFLAARSLHCTILRLALAPKYRLPQKVQETNLTLDLSPAFSVCLQAMPKLEGMQVTGSLVNKGHVYALLGA